MSQASILTRITDSRRASMQQLASRAEYSVARLQDAINALPSRPQRSLRQALKQADKGFILECKKASPSKGLIRDPFDPVAIAAVYQQYAAAISVLTEPDYFQGDFAYLQAVSQRVHVPVICKDFIVEPVHVYLARLYAADAILLMLSVLTDEAYTELATLAHSLGMEVLTEVSNEDEMRRAAKLDAAIIGINHRNLHDLSIDLTRSQQLAPLAPEHAVLVAESGISDNQQVRDIGRFVDGFLVGSHLTAQADIDQACRALIYGQHKVCGLTSPAAALQARSAGARFGGLIFAPQSPRHVDIAQAQQIIRQTQGLQFVAVTTSHALEQLTELAQQLDVQVVQLHAQQSDELVRALLAKLGPGQRLWYALNMANLAQPLGATIAHLRTLGIDKVVLDQGQGGSGKTFDWSLLNELSAAERQHCLLAGGLTPDNVQQAASVGCFGLDMNSGLESAPGVKDPAKVGHAFNQLMRYFRENQQHDHQAMTDKHSDVTSAAPSAPLNGEVV